MYVVFGDICGCCAVFISLYRLDVKLIGGTVVFGLLLIGLASICGSVDFWRLIDTVGFPILVDVSPPRCLLLLGGTPFMKVY